MPVSSKEELLMDLARGKQAVFYVQENQKFSAQVQSGYFNISINDPKDSDNGLYSCIFTTEENISMSATIYLWTGEIHTCSLLIN